MSGRGVEVERWAVLNCHSKGRGWGDEAGRRLGRAQTREEERKGEERIRNKSRRLQGRRMRRCIQKAQDVNGNVDRVENFSGLINTPS